MLEYVIRGCVPLQGTLRIQGAKNSVLPILAASVLCDEKITLHNVPNLRDVCVSISMLESLGCMTERKGGTLSLWPNGVSSVSLEQPDCSMMRSSVLFLGPLLSKYHRAELYFPGGCVLGERPIDLHVEALRAMGAEFEDCKDQIIAKCLEGLHGAVISLRYPSVGATENVLMASVLAKGETILYNRAKEPEIDDLIDMLCRMGADIRVFKDKVVVRGVERLTGCEKRIMADRIAAFTYMAVALATDGEITIEDCPVGALSLPLEILAAAGGGITRNKDRVTIRRAGPFILPVEHLVSGPYPAFPTDAGAIVLALLSMAQGESVFTETVFSNRFKVVEQLERFGANICVDRSTARVNGVQKLRGSRARATDLRAGAALLVAALAAEGESRIDQGELILRGYENITATLRTLGADITERSV